MYEDEKFLTVTIDGSAGSGKSFIAGLIAGSGHYEVVDRQESQTRLREVLVVKRKNER